MAKKSKKVEKETRRLIEGITDLVKKKGDRYKFKSKNKKKIKMIKRTCVHWIIRKGKEVPATVADPENPSNWKCMICGATFPIKPVEKDEYRAATEHMLAFVNQMQFWSVKLGGDADDTKMFLKLKETLPRFEKVSNQILKQVNKRQAWESNREKSDLMSQFDAYGAFSYKP